MPFVRQMESFFDDAKAKKVVCLPLLLPGEMNILQIQCNI